MKRILTISILLFFYNSFALSDYIVKIGEIELRIPEVTDSSNQLKNDTSRLRILNIPIKEYSKEMLLKNLNKFIVVNYENNIFDVKSFKITVQGDNINSKIEKKYHSNLLNSNDVIQILKIINSNKRTTIRFNEIELSNAKKLSETVLIIK